jgi:hypothetical protein
MYRKKWVLGIGCIVFAIVALESGVIGRILFGRWQANPVTMLQDVSPGMNINQIIAKYGYPHHVYTPHLYPNEIYYSYYTDRWNLGFDYYGIITDASGIVTSEYIP